MTEALWKLSYFWYHPQLYIHAAQEGFCLKTDPESPPAKSMVHKTLKTISYLLNYISIFVSDK